MERSTGTANRRYRLGRSHSQCCVLDSQGDIIAEGQFSSNQGAFERYFKDVRRVRIAIEAGAHSRWVSELLSGYGHEVLIANPRNVQLISESIRKSDRVDARAVARLARVDPSLLSPLTHRKTATYPHMAQLRARHVLVRSRTSVVNAIRGMAKAVGVRLPACSTETFASKISPLLPDALKESLLPLLETIVTLNLQIQKCDRAIYHLAKYKYPETERLRQVSGVGVNTALEFVLTIEDPHRFQKSRQVGAYLGIQPKQRDSGDRAPNSVSPRPATADCDPCSFNVHITSSGLSVRTVIYDAGAFSWRHEAGKTQRRELLSLSLEKWLCCYIGSGLPGRSTSHSDDPKVVNWLRRMFRNSSTT